MKIFIDAGAHKGESVERFLRSDHYTPDTLIYAFEPNPYNTIKTSASNLIAIRKAVWIKDGRMDFYVGKRQKDTEGSSLIKEKTSGDLDKGNPVCVDCIDFGKWLRENTKIEDGVILKMDIEGAEYPVLEQMIEDGSIAYVDILYLEAHYSRMPDKDTAWKRHKELVKKLIQIPGLQLRGEFAHIRTDLNKIRVYAIPSGDIDGASSRLRCYRRLNFLPDPFVWKLFKKGLDCDLLYVQKAAWAIETVRDAKRRMIPIIYDCDDGDGTPGSRRKDGNDQEMFEIADLITTDTWSRAEAFRRNTKTPVLCIPDGIDYFDTVPPRVKIKEKIAKIVTFGSPRSVAATLPYLNEIPGEYMVSYITREPLKGFERFKFIKWDRHTMIDKIVGKDLCILAHEDNYESQYKSNQRLLVAMAMGMPTIVANQYGYSNNVKEIGLDWLVFDLGQVKEKIMALHDYSTRDMISLKFRAEAWSKWSGTQQTKTLANEIYRLVRRDVKYDPEIFNIKHSGLMGEINDEY